MAEWRSAFRVDMSSFGLGIAATQVAKKKKAAPYLLFGIWHIGHLPRISLDLRI